MKALVRLNEFPGPGRTASPIMTDLSGDSGDTVNNVTILKVDDKAFVFPAGYRGVTNRCFANTRCSVGGFDLLHGHATGGQGTCCHCLFSGYGSV